MEQGYCQAAFAPAGTYRQFVNPTNMRSLADIMTTERSTRYFITIHCEEPEQWVKIAGCDAISLPFLECVFFVTPAIPETFIHCLIGGVVILTGNKGTHVNSIGPYR